MVSFREIGISVILVMVFTFSLFAFGSQLAEDNNSNSSILNNPIINQSYQDIKTNLNQSNIIAEEQKQSWYKDVPILQDAGLVWGSITGMVRVFFDIIIGSYNLFKTLFIKTGIVPAIVLTAIVTIILMSTLLLIWRLIRTGD